MDKTTPSNNSLQLNKAESKLLYLLAGLQFTHIVDFMIMMPLGPMLARDLGIATHEFGLLVASYTFSAAVSGLLCAIFIERFERKTFLLGLYILFGIATLACALAPTYGWLLFARALAGGFGGILGAIVNTVVADNIPPQRRGQAMGIISSSFAAATVAGVPASLWLAGHIDTLGWRAPFIFVVILSAALGAAAFAFIPSGKKPLPIQGSALSIGIKSIVTALSDRQQQLALVFAMLVMLSSFTVIPYLTIYATKNVGFPESMLSLMYLVGGTFTLFTARLIGRWADVRGKLFTYRILALLAILPVTVVTHLGVVPPWVYILTSTLFFVLVSGRWIPAQALIAGVTLPASRGTFMSLMSCAIQLAMGVGSYVSGHIISTGANGKIVDFEMVGYLSIVAALSAVWLSSKLVQRN